MTLTNLMSFLKDMCLRYNDGQGTRDIVTFLGADFVDGMQLKCKIQKIKQIRNSCRFEDTELH